MNSISENEKIRIERDFYRAVSQVLIKHRNGNVLVSFLIESAKKVNPAYSMYPGMRKLIDAILEDAASSLSEAQG